MKNFSHIIFILLLAGCKKDIPEPISKCDPLPPTPVIGWYNILPDTGISAPCFNPENPKEFIYREHHYKTGEFWLCKFNLITLEKEYIFQADFNSFPKWGKEDWIIFTLSDYNVYKIKSNGRDLTQLTDNGKSFEPGWGYKFELIYFYSFLTYEDTSRPGSFIDEGIGLSLDLEGNTLDTLWGGWSEIMSSPINDSTVVMLDYYGLNLFNIYSGARDYLFYEEDPNEIKYLGITLLKKHEVLWSSYYGMYMTDLNTETTTGIAPTCNSNFYSNPTYAPQTNKVIWEHVVKIPKGGYLEGKKEFVIMNPDGTDSQIIKIR